MSSQAVIQPSRLLAYMRLMRLPNVFTAMADVAMGFLVTHESHGPLAALILLLLSSSSLYIGGMVLNDVYDIDIDRIERPSRPLPSGQISRNAAANLGYALLIVGMLACIAVRFCVDGGWWVGTVAFPLAGLILAYDRFLKHTPLGPVAMGGCRFLNVLLGMSAAVEPWANFHWTIAAGLGVYIAGVTWFARREAGDSPRLQLAGALLTMLCGIALLWSYPRQAPENLLQPMVKAQPQNWSLLWGMLAAIIGWRALRAVLQPSPTHVQATVKTAILSIIVLDAALVFAMHGPAASIAILLLLIPTIVLGWWVYST